MSQTSQLDGTLVDVPFMNPLQGVILSRPVHCHSCPKVALYEVTRRDLPPRFYCRWHLRGVATAVAVRKVA